MILQSNIWLLRSCSPIVQGLKVCSMNLTRVCDTRSTNCNVCDTCGNKLQSFFHFFSICYSLESEPKTILQWLFAHSARTQSMRMHLISEHVIPTVQIAKFLMLFPHAIFSWLVLTICYVEYHKQFPQLNRTQKSGDNICIYLSHMKCISQVGCAQSLPDVMSLSITDRLVGCLLCGLVNQKPHHS
jgi:hypothetical protein